MSDACANCGSEVRELPSGKLQCTGYRTLIRDVALAPTEKRIWEIAAEIRRRNLQACWPKEGR